MILSPEDIKTSAYFRKLGIFLMIVATDNRIKLIYHLTPGKSNILTNHSTNYKAINEFIDKGATVEVKDLTQEQILIEKVVNIDKLLDISKDSSLTTLVPLGRNNTSFRSFTFCPRELLKLLVDLDKHKWGPIRL